MEAWIVHIYEEWIDESKTGSILSNDKYSAWATEKLALKHIGNLIASELNRPWGGLFMNRTELAFAISTLLQHEKIQEIISLINRYTEAEVSLHNKNSGSSKIRIKIIESKFLGSPFE
jgi:hypothetical protein